MQVSSLTLPVTAILVHEHPARAISLSESATLSLQLAGRTNFETLCRQIEHARPELARNTPDGPVWTSDRLFLTRAYARARKDQDTDKAGALAYRLQRVLSSPATEAQRTPFPPDQQACVAALKSEQEADNARYFAYETHTD